jgi:hypothetical protein
MFEDELSVWGHILSICTLNAGTRTGFVGIINTLLK